MTSLRPVALLRTQLPFQPLFLRPCWYGLVGTDVGLHLALPQCFSRRNLAQAWSSPWAEPGHVLRTLTQDSNLYTVHFLVFILLVQSCWGQAPRNGIHSSRSSSPPLSSTAFTLTPESAWLWRSRKGSPSASHPPAQAYLLGSIVPRGNVQCK